MDLGPVLNAHAYLRVERPPVLWEAEAEDGPLLRMLGEMLAAALARGTALEEIVLRASNVTVEKSSEPSVPAAGDYVALTVLGGAGEWAPEVTWSPERGSGTGFVSPELEAALAPAGVAFAYCRSSGVGGSVTVFLRRAGQPSSPPVWSSPD